MYYFPFHLMSANEVGVLLSLGLALGLLCGRKASILPNTKINYRVKCGEIWLIHARTVRC